MILLSGMRLRRLFYSPAFYSTKYFYNIAVKKTQQRPCAVTEAFKDVEGIFYLANISEYTTSGLLTRILYSQNLSQASW